MCTDILTPFSVGASTADTIKNLQELTLHNVRERIFRLKQSYFTELKIRIDQLSSQSEAHEPDEISMDMILKVFTWCQITKARLSNKTHQVPIEEQVTPTSKLWLTFDYSQLIGSALPPNYVGITSLPISVEQDVSLLIKACDVSDNDEGLQAFVHVIRAINKAKAAITEEYVGARLALCRCFQDPREVGLAWDPSANIDVMWVDLQAIGNELPWNIPGTQGTKPQAIRAPFQKGKVGTCTVLPGGSKGAGNGWELAIKLLDKDLKALEEGINWKIACK